MNTIVIAIALAFSLSMLNSCSREESPPVSSKQETSSSARDSSEQATKDTERAGPTRDSKEAAKGTEGTTTTGERRSGTATSDSPSATPGAMGGRTERDVSRTSSSDQNRTSAGGQKTVAEEIASNRMLTIEGVLTKIEGDSYVVKEVSGTEVKIRADDKTKKDSNLTVGDSIVARLEGPGVAAASITKR